MATVNLLYFLAAPKRIKFGFDKSCGRIWRSIVVSVRVCASVWAHKWRLLNHNTTNPIIYAHISPCVTRQNMTSPSIFGWDFLLWLRVYSRSFSKLPSHPLNQMKISSMARLKLFCLRNLAFRHWNNFSALNPISSNQQTFKKGPGYHVLCLKWLWNVWSCTSSLWLRKLQCKCWKCRSNQKERELAENQNWKRIPSNEVHNLLWNTILSWFFLK